MNRKSKIKNRKSACRGTAEIELLLSVIVLITILMLVAGSFNIGIARLNTVENAAYQALGNAATGAAPLYTNDPDLAEVTTIAEIRPGLPNRTHVSHTAASVTVYAGANQNLPTTTIKNTSAAISPAWSFSAYPASGTDSGATGAWFEGFANERFPDGTDPATLADSLLLAQPWTP